jgi:hypothetical protein
MPDTGREMNSTILILQEDAVWLRAHSLFLTGVPFFEIYSAANLMLAIV